MGGTWPAWPDITWIALGTLDDDARIKPSLNITIVGWASAHHRN